jgi:septal ring factor EnvC (AmiA/AmiB activator)
MAEEWLTYHEAGKRLGSTGEAVRYRALRGKWPRRRGNDGRARVQIPEDAQDVRTPSAQPVRTASTQGVRTPSARRSDQALTHALESHIKTLQADVEALKEQLAASSRREARLVADLAAEQAKTAQEADKAGKAIAAFAALAESFDALASARTKPWWRRLVG